MVVGRRKKVARQKYAYRLAGCLLCSRWGPNAGTPLLADLSMLNQRLVTCMIQLAMIKIVIPVKLVNLMELVSSVKLVILVIICWNVYMKVII